MNRTSKKMFEELRLYKRHYVIQCLLATFTVFIVLLFLSMRNAVIIASIGASAFIIFAMPKNITAKPRKVIGGHCVGLLAGSLCAMIPHPGAFFSALVYALAVGISFFIMVVIDTEHPPAAATSLGFAITGFSMNAAVALLISILILSFVHHFFRPYLKDLT